MDEQCTFYVTITVKQNHLSFVNTGTLALTLIYPPVFQHLLQIMQTILVLNSIGSLLSNLKKHSLGCLRLYYIVACMNLAANQSFEAIERVSSISHYAMPTENQ